MADSFTFGDWLWVNRKVKRGLTQEQLAEKIPVARDYIRMIESGRRLPSKALAEKLLVFFDVPEDKRPSLMRFARGGSLDDETILSLIPASALRSRRKIQSALPAQTTTFVGRVPEVKQVRELMLDKQKRVRLLTLTGPPGIGKTRLSLQVAASFHRTRAFEDGVFFVSLSPVSDPSLVVPAICKVLGVKEVFGQPMLDTLVDYLQDKRALLVLDNFEQVIPAGPEIGELMKNCPDLQVMVTSRAVLRVYGEHEFPVPVMTLPGNGKSELPDLDALTQFEAVDLFVQRSRAVKPDFTLTAENAPHVVEICRRLDALPLAIELAAARIKMLPPDALLTRLDKRLQLLKTGMVDVPKRQQTLRGAIDWSYDLLSEDEKRLYRRLSVFVGNVELKAIEEVCVLGAEDHFSTSVFELMTLLMEKSLVRQDEVTGDPKFWMLWTIREYAQERLEESGEGEVIKRRHAEHYLRMAEDLEPHMTSGGRGQWLDRLEYEHNNLRAGLEWCLSERGDREMGLRLAGALGWFWYFRSYLSEGRDWLEKALALAGEHTHSAVGAKALNATGRLAMQYDNFATAYSRLEESVAIWRGVDDKLGLAYALSDLGITIMNRGELSAGYSLIEDGVELFREVGDKWGLAFALNRLADGASYLDDFEKPALLYRESLTLFRELEDKWGIAIELRELGNWALYEGDYASARSMLQDALALEWETGDKWHIAIIARTLGDALQLQGDYVQAEAHYYEALALNRELGDTMRIAGSLRVLGHVARHLGDCGRAERLYRESLNLFRSVDDKRGMTVALAGLAGAALEQARHETAACLLGVAGAMHNPGLIYQPVDTVEYERNLSNVHEKLGDAAFEATWAKGQAMTIEQAIAYVGEENEFWSKIA